MTMMTESVKTDVLSNQISKNKYSKTLMPVLFGASAPHCSQYFG